MFCLKTVVNMFVLLNGKVGLLSQLSPLLLNSSRFNLVDALMRLKYCIKFVSFILNLILN